MRIVLLASVLCLAACSAPPSNPDSVRDRAADTTAAVKRDTKAIVEGVKEGWKRDSPVDLNTASEEQLQSLPGITPELSAKIVANRPYSSAPELVSRKVLARPVYDKIANRITVKKH